MKHKRIRVAAFLFGLLMASTSVMADPVLNVAAHSIDLESVTNLGEVNVDGVGKVQLTARRNGSQVVVQAVGPGEVVLGRAETTVGLSQTPVYMRTPTGLEKVTVFWGVTEK